MVYIVEIIILAVALLVIGVYLVAMGCRRNVSVEIVSDEIRATNLNTVSVSRPDAEDMPSENTSGGTAVLVKYAGSTCSVCLHEQVDRVFLPCGHTSCENCCKNLETCHLCRSVICHKHQLFLV